MKLDEFAKSIENLVEDYKADYLAGHAKSPENYPLSLINQGEWWSDFFCWLELSNRV